MKKDLDKNFDAWNEKKKIIDSKNRKIYFRKKEIWWCSLGVNVGHEQDGKNDNFERPILVLKKINRNLALIIPLSSKIKEHPYYFKYEYGGKNFSAILFQIKIVSTKRFLRKLGMLEQNIFNGIIKEIVKFIGK